MLPLSKPGIHPPTPVAAHRTTCAPRRDPLRRRPVSGLATSQSGFGPQALQDFAPWSARVPITLELCERLVQDLFFGGTWSWASYDILLLQLTQLAQHLISLLMAQLWKFSEDIGFAHAPSLTCREIKGKPGHV